MRKTILLVCLIIGVGLQGKAQNAYLFKPYSFLSAQAGAGYSYNEQNSSDNISIALAVYYGYRFHKFLAVRAGLSGMQVASSAYITSKKYQPYTCNYVQGNADLLIDLCSLFAGYNPYRKFTPYLLVGAGGNFAFANNNAQKLARELEADLSTWGSMVSAAGRCGIGFNHRLSEHSCLNVELNANMMNDDINSHKDGTPDIQFNGVAGLTFYFGKGGTGIKNNKHKHRKNNIYQDL